MAEEKKSASVKHLTVEHQAALDSFLLADHPIDKLVKIVKEEWGELPDSTPAAVRRMLYRYKDKVIKPKQSKIAAKHSSHEGLQDLVAHIAKLEDRLNPILMMEQLALKQWARLDKLAKTEKNAPTLLEAQTKNIALMGDLLTKLTNAQLEVGVLTRVARPAMSVTTPDGTTVTVGAPNEQLNSALTETMAMLQEAGVIDVDAKVVGELTDVPGSA